MNAHIDENAAHAIYAPSSAHRWTVCTASATAISKLGEQEEGDEAAEGTRAHDEIERVLGPYSGDGLGWWLENPNTLVNPLDNDHPAAYGVALLLEYVRGLPPGPLWIEQRVHLTEQIWGRCDVAHWDPASETLTIIDYKNGFVDVDAVENEQLRIYAAGSIFTHKLPARWVRYVVVQPNSFMPVPRVKQWLESAEALFAFAERTAAIPRGPLTFQAGEQCKYCPLFGRCPASQDVLVRLSAMLANAPDAVRPDQIAMFKACEKPIADWFKALDKAATKAALAGSVAPGMALVTGTKHRGWKSAGEARAAVVGALGADALELPTPAQAEKLGMAKAEVAALAETPEGGPVLAFASDKRKPWTGGKSSTEMFKGIPGVS
jgi:hypothetical protein